MPNENVPTAPIGGEAAMPEPTAAPAAEAPAASPAPAVPGPKPEPDTKAATAAAAPEPAPAPPEPKAQERPAEDIEAIKEENAVLRAGIKPEHITDAVALVKSRMKGDVTFEQALEAVVKGYPMFKGDPPPKISPSVPVKNDAADIEDDARIDRIMGIKRT